VISSNQMVGALSAIVGAYQIPFETIAPVSWRKQFLGFGTRPGWQRKDWKKAVRDRCAHLKITVTNDDMADAAGIAFAGASMQTFKMMQNQARAA
jgi:Holliday junction resolvasome RuvABC endonuclease subunit